MSKGAEVTQFTTKGTGDEWHCPTVQTDQTEPILRTPVSDFFARVNHMQSGRCADFDLRLQECYEAYGYHPGSPKCQDYRDDLYECHFRLKQVHRYNAMIKERERQYKAGERTKENYYDIKQSFPERY